MLRFRIACQWILYKFEANENTNVHLTDEKENHLWLHVCSFFPFFSMAMMLSLPQRMGYNNGFPISFEQNPTEMNSKHIEKQ